MCAVTTPITSEVLYATSSLVNTPRRLNMMFMPLDESERLTAGSVVGIDAEFVTLNQVRGLGLYCDTYVCTYPILFYESERLSAGSVVGIDA